jgi:hypothetical protein
VTTPTFDSLAGTMYAAGGGEGWTVFTRGLSNAFARGRLVAGALRVTGLRVAGAFFLAAVFLVVGFLAVVLRAVSLPVVLFRAGVFLRAVGFARRAGRFDFGFVFDFGAARLADAADFLAGRFFLPAVERRVFIGSVSFAQLVL